MLQLLFLLLLLSSSSSTSSSPSSLLLQLFLLLSLLFSSSSSASLSLLSFLSRAGGAALGHPEEPAGHELRQAEPLAALLLRERHHAEGGWRALRLQVRLRPGSAFQHGVPGRSPVVPQAGRRHARDLQGRPLPAARRGWGGWQGEGEARWPPSAPTTTPTPTRTSTTCSRRWPPATPPRTTTTTTITTTNRTTSSSRQQRPQPSATTSSSSSSSSSNSNNNSSSSSNNNNNIRSSSSNRTTTSSNLPPSGPAPAGREEAEEEGVPSTPPTLTTPFPTTTSTTTSSSRRRATRTVSWTRSRCPSPPPTGPPPLLPPRTREPRAPYNMSAMATSHPAAMTPEQHRLQYMQEFHRMYGAGPYMEGCVYWGTGITVLFCYTRGRMHGHLLHRTVCQLNESYRLFRLDYSADKYCCQLSFRLRVATTARYVSRQVIRAVNTQTAYLKITSGFLRVLLTLSWRSKCMWFTFHVSKSLVCHLLPFARPTET